jgi:hypothetical protein
MPTRARKRKAKVDEAEDVNTLNKRIVSKATGQDTLPKTPNGKNPWAVALGKLGASKGGRARAEKLTHSQRSDIAKRAAEARWSKR